MTRNGAPSPAIRKRTAVLLVIFALVSLLVGTCAIWVRSINLGDRKADHVFAMPGSAPLTNEQMANYAQQVLVLDGRDVANMKPEDFATTQVNVSVESDGSVCLGFRHAKTGWQWYVVLKREEGRVVGFSYHGL
jgi:hypothetical protein